MVKRPSLRPGTVRETLPEVRKWSGDPLGGLELVGRPSRRSFYSPVSGWEALPEVRERS